MPNISAQGNKKLGNLESSLVVSRCIPKADAGREAGISHTGRASTLTSPLVCSFHFTPALCTDVCVSTEVVLQLLHPFRLHLSPQKY